MKIKQTEKFQLRETRNASVNIEKLNCFVRARKESEYPNFCFTIICRQRFIIQSAL